MRLGYKSHGGLKHVERFMKHYCLEAGAQDAGEVTDILGHVLVATPGPTVYQCLGHTSADPLAAPLYRCQPD